MWLVAQLDPEWCQPPQLLYRLESSAVPPSTRKRFHGISSWVGGTVGPQVEPNIKPSIQAGVIICAPFYLTPNPILPLLSVLVYPLLPPLLEQIPAGTERHGDTTLVEVCPIYLLKENVSMEYFHGLAAQVDPKWRQSPQLLYRLESSSAPLSTQPWP